MTIDVAVGVIAKQDTPETAFNILISQRLPTQSMPGYWEFPGGKLEAGESAEAALIRELTEEVGIHPTIFSPLLTIHHQYTQTAVNLHVFWVNAFRGEPVGKEGQTIAWVKVCDLQGYTFPEANHSIVEIILQKARC